MAIDLFLKVPGIPGTSTLRRHAKEIVLRSFSWGVATPTAGSRPTFAPLNITKPMDTASPRLEQAAITGRVFPTMTLSVARGGKEPFDLAVYRFSNASITNFAEHAPSDEGLVSENLAIQYSDVQLTVRVQRPTG